eukprot:NODE_7673_length_426_cov_427.579515.p3 GENE.NODE_7673_length_426_cov_427.579515~~NODE_7673_length_426_cov_427.579515.p3  ORF type:complete len:58 (+),score=3.83 NODE_7673_length_426_cov_427.579515:177-350(+)
MAPAPGGVSGILYMMRCRKHCWCSRRRPELASGVPCGCCHFGVADCAVGSAECRPSI